MNLRNRLVQQVSECIGSESCKENVKRFLKISSDKRKSICKFDAIYEHGCGIFSTEQCLHAKSVPTFTLSAELFLLEHFNNAMRGKF